MREKLTKTGYVCALGYTMREPDEPIQAALTKADGKMYENKAAIKAAMQERGETLHYRDNRIR